MNFPQFNRDNFSLESPGRATVLAITGVYFLLMTVILMVVPFSPGLISLLFLPVIYTSITSDLRVSLGVNTLFLVYFLIYEAMGWDFTYFRRLLILFFTVGIFSFSVIFLVHHFRNIYRKKQQKLRQSMEQLSQSHKKLEATQTKLMALTWITKDLLTVQDRQQLTSKLINLLNRYMLFENILYCRYRTGDREIAIEASLGFEEINREELLVYLEPDQLKDKGIEVFDIEELKPGYRLIVVPIFRNQELNSSLIVVNKTDWISQEDKYIMDILADHINLVLNNIELIEDTRKLAVTDGGTDLYNHRYFFDKLEDLFYRARKREGKLSVVIFDIDNFKDINDDYGHLVGDRILNNMSDLLRQNVRRQDILARYGGDEFALLLPGTDRCQASEISERIIEEVANHKFESDAGEIIQTSLSGGIATYPDLRVKNPVELVKRADFALYVSKDRGKNRVISEEELCG